MTHPWLIDCADRLEAAAEVARDLRSLGTLGAGPLRVRVEYLAERLWETAQRIGVFQEMGSGLRAQLAHALCDLYRVACRARLIARAEGFAAAGDGFDAIATELHALIAEIAALGVEPPRRPLATLVVACGVSR